MVLVFIFRSYAVSDEKRWGGGGARWVPMSTKNTGHAGYRAQILSRYT